MLRFRFSPPRHSTLSGKKNENTKETTKGPPYLNINWLNQASFPKSMKTSPRHWPRVHVCWSNGCFSQMQVGVGFSEFEEASFLSNLHFPPGPDSSEDTEYHKTPHTCSLFDLIECLFSPQFWDGSCFSFCSCGSISLESVCGSARSQCEQLPKLGFKLKFPDSFPICRPQTCLLSFLGHREGT